MIYQKNKQEKNKKQNSTLFVDISFTRASLFLLMSIFVGVSTISTKAANNSQNEPSVNCRLLLQV